MKKADQKRLTRNLDREDLKIEKGTLDPKGNFFYPKGVLNVLEAVFEEEKLGRPRGKESPVFSFEEIQAIVDLIFFKPRNIILKIYERTPHRKGLPLRRKVFLSKLLGEAKFNGAKAARMAGYSSRSAKQIAYKIKKS